MPDAFRHPLYFPDAFPHFGTEAYWESETRDLEEQVDRIRDERPGSEPLDEANGPAGGEGEVESPTNKDFFWDL